MHVCLLREIQADYFHGVKIKSHNKFKLLRISSHHATKGNDNHGNYQDTLVRLTLVVHHSYELDSRDIK